MNQADVIVVGAGPVGLVVACELRLAGVSVTVLERRTERMSQSRALTVHGRSVEMLGLRGLAERIVPLGMRIPTGHFAALDTRLDFSACCGFSNTNTRYPFTLFLPQSRTEQVLEEWALELGVDLHRGSQVETVSQDSDGVSVSGTRDGNPYHLHSRYLVGADGARSRVRQQADIAFPGHAAGKTAMLGDVTLAAPPASPAVVQWNAAGGLMIVPLGDGRHRMIVIDAARMREVNSPAPTLEELAGVVRSICGTDFGMHDPVWLSRFNDETRLAASYRKERIFLAGDAAHMHFPAGGQGMNVGIQDAMNLGWKLAAVVNGHAPDALLDSYHAERHPVGAALNRNTMAQTALLMAFEPDGLALRAAVSDMLTVPELNKALANDLSAFGIAYPAALSPLPQGENVVPEWTGQRLPDWPLRLADGSATSLHALMQDGKWLLLQMDGGTFSPQLAPGWFHTVQGTADQAQLRDLKAILVRPDGYADYAIARQ